MEIDLTVDESIILQSSLKLIRQRLTSERFKNEIELINAILVKIGKAQSKEIALAEIERLSNFYEISNSKELS